jgi:exodeoxyribonuclease V beta subunit
MKGNTSGTGMKAASGNGPLAATAMASAEALAAAEERPESIALLDLSKPGLLEASAGTGKTYAIEHLVLRILIETERIELPQILVLTFTEKATGELKDKIRARIAWRIARGGLPARTMERLKRAHLEFDRAAIHTIHGFCQRVLRKYAFENNALFRQDLLKNVDEALQQELYEAMRSTWISEAGPGPDGLAAFRSRAAALGMGARTKWQKRITDIAKGFNPLRGDLLLPDYDPARIGAFEAEMAAAFADILRLVPDLKAGAEADHPFAKRFAAIRFVSAATRTKGMQILVAAFRQATACAAIADAGERARAAAAFPALIQAINLTGIKKQGFRFLLPTSEEDRNPWPELEPVLMALDRILGLDARIQAERAALAYAPKRNAILEVRDKAQARFKAEGIITYDSMIEDVCLALRQKEARVDMLRLDYRYCLVDEFQDTDPLQWEIFERVFLKSGSANPLYLIGDPKQAIYRFRGGDVYTYMEARKAMFALSRQGKAQGLGLDTNYRSSGGMVEAYNAAFTHRGWFHAHPIDPTDTAWRLPAEPDPLGYVPVKHGDLAVQKPIDSTASGKPIILKDFAVGDPDKHVLKRRVNHWIVTEIAALMAEPERLRIPDKATGGFRPLAWGDICVLVRKSREKDALLRLLAEAGIPAQVARRSGLYEGDAAGQYLAVLESLEDPGDPGKHARALLTRFFRAPGDPPPDRPPETPHPLFEEWLRLAARRRWQKLFHSLQYRSGLLYRESLGEEPDRRIMDFIHVGQNLVQEAIRENLNLGALVQRLKDLRAAAPGASGTDEDADMHREESEGGKVVLMTMHVSKGLEFPVVFLANFSGNPPQTHFKYRDGLNTVYHLNTGDAAARRAYQEESEGEDRRLYYVALTRARYKLYVPLLPPGSGNGTTGPLGGFVAEALRTAAALKPDLYHFAPAEDYSLPQTPLPRSGNAGAAGPPQAGSTPPASASLSGSAAAATTAAADAFLSDYPREDRLARPDAEFSRRRRRLASYSHLVRNSHGLSSETVEGRFDKEDAPLADSGPRGDADPDAPEPVTPAFPGNALPRGKDTGNMFHEILECLDFAAVERCAVPGDLFAHTPTRDLIDARMEDHRLGPEWRDGVAEVVWNTLRAPLPDPAGGPAFSLSEVSQADLRPEMEFLFPYPDGYLWGFIDLVFRHRGRYYLLDWKSNHLDAYGSAELDRSMRESRYDVQYMLYSLALDKWLRSLIPDYRYEGHFGGVYYLYLRGMRAPRPLSGSDAGVFALKPTSAQMAEEFPTQLAGMMGLSGTGGLSGAPLVRILPHGSGSRT